MISSSKQQINESIKNRLKLWGIFFKLLVCGRQVSFPLPLGFWRRKRHYKWEEELFEKSLPYLKSVFACV